MLLKWSASARNRVINRSPNSVKNKEKILNTIEKRAYQTETAREHSWFPIILHYYLMLCFSLYCLLRSNTIPYIQFKAEFSRNVKASKFRKIFLGIKFIFVLTHAKIFQVYCKEYLQRKCIPDKFRGWKFLRQNTRFRRVSTLKPVRSSCTRCFITY